MSNPIMQKMLDQFRIKIIKKEQDARTTFRGERFIQVSDPEHDGTAIDGIKKPYVVVSAHDPDYLKNICTNMNYQVSEPFIPQVKVPIAPVQPDPPTPPAPPVVVPPVVTSSEEVPVPVGDPATPTANPLKCPKCDFVAKNENGLRLHAKSHKE